MSLIAPKTHAERRRSGALAVVVGLALVVWGVFHVLGPVGDLQRSRPGRIAYNEVKPVVHAAFLGALLRAGFGAVVLLRGLKWLQHEEPEA